MPDKRAQILFSLVLIVLLAGCRNAQQSAPAAEWVTLGAPAPISSNSTRGLEVQMWIVDNTDHAVHRLLMPYDTVSGVFDESERQRWRAWGLRWCVVPIAEVNALLSALRPVQPARVQWLGEFTQWRPIVRAGTIEAQSVRVGDGESDIATGKPRLIARSWIEPMMTDLGIRPGVRADIALQIEQPRSARSLWSIEDDELPMIDDEGPIVDGLVSALRADGLHTLVLVADAPGRDWSNLPEPIDDSQSVPSEDDPIGPSARADDEHGADADDETSTEPIEETQGEGSAVRERDERHGPSGAELRSLGELMFTTKGSGSARFGGVYDPPRSVVVILIPRTEGGFGLLPALEDGAESERSVGDE